jgi:predicted kinase
MRTIFILIGLPAAGKSTWAKALLKAEPSRWVRLNKDSIRSMAVAFWTPESENMINKIQSDAMCTALNADKDVILDNTHLTSRARKDIYSLAEKIGDITVIEKVFPETLAVCLQRNSLRTDDKVPEETILSMYKKAGFKNGYPKGATTYFPPVSPALYVPPIGKPKAIICDLDGTLALMNGRNPYDATTCDQDLPNMPVIACVKAMHAAGMAVIFMSGREDKYLEPTERFIAQHAPVPYKLFMRLTGDQRKDSIIKRELFDAHVRNNYDVQFTLDDRNSVVDFWRSIGLTCFQVQPGPF